MTKREKVYLKDTDIWDSIDHEASKEQFPETYAKLDTLLQFSNKYLVWKCSVEGHESQIARITNRSQGRGCRSCGVSKRAKSRGIPKNGNSLAGKRPDLVLEWDLDKNELTPYDVAFSSGKNAWWKCAEGHSWQAKINNRTNGRGCPFCSGRRATDANRLSINRPELSGEWDFDKNELTPYDVTVSSHKRAWWKCVEGHHWQSTINSRSKGSGCPFCSGNLVSDTNRLSTNRPDLVREWDPDKNELTPRDVPVSSHKRAWWVCEKRHSWQAVIKDRSDGNGCPFCSGRLVSDTNRLSINRPKIASEWDHDKNELTPSEVSVFSHTRAWWKCVEGHHWQAQISDRSNGKGCPFCCGKLVSDTNRLSINNPGTAREWDFTKNKLTPEDVSVFSNKKAWWVCAEGHSWQAQISSRSTGTGCPKCAKRTSRIEKRFIDVFTERTDLTVTAHGIRLKQLTYASGRKGIEVDIVLYQNNHYLLVEYDGSHWHREKTELDTEKSRALLSLGDNILHARIRENDLPELDLVHDRFAQFRHDYHATESDSISETVRDIENWFLEKIGE